ncbi:hypothetical protein BV22DRAFT_585798 [Leucogyrophana mollusca]|uniref:Uncharacterized protein n=1 Tax=Leucogyrophana mollusca TaxID=85980 RepID=A0ACB8BCL0_9AGAM|nr:hypothetical protein BV22DRAFT_585798 [Leucogyrophana mollusca]
MDASSSHRTSTLGFVDPWASPQPPPPVIRAISPPRAPTTRAISPRRTLSPQPQPIARALSPQPQRTVSLQPHSQGIIAPQPRTLIPGSFSATSSGRTTPVSAEPEVKSMTGMSKEEKAAEMARRKEERRLVSYFSD